VNREAMQRSDERAKRLGNAGSWAAVFLAMASFIASVVVIRLMRRRVITPLGKIHDVIVSVRQGNLHRRCSTTEMSGEIVMLASEVNGLIERLERQLTAP
jgi:nitrate/nitrite-specific signal transduction histidine kinase